MVFENLNLIEEIGFFIAYNLNINFKPTEANCMATGMHSEAKRMQTTHGEARKSKRK